MKTRVLFSRYVLMGIINTLIHWSVFFLVYTAFGASQAFSNLLAFLFAVTFSFFANARFTFKSPASLKRYVLFVSFMGALSLFTGWGADRLGILPLMTLVFFSGISLILGFIYSRYIVFRP